MLVPTRLVVAGVVAGAALAYYVRTRRDRTGEGYVQIVRQLPGDAARWADRTRERAAHALEEGKTAARDRETELTLQLQAAGAPDGI